MNEILEIKVTNEFERESIQRILFNYGFRWGSGDTHIRYLEQREGMNFLTIWDTRVLSKSSYGTSKRPCDFNYFIGLIEDFMDHFGDGSLLSHITDYVKSHPYNNQ